MSTTIERIVNATGLLELLNEIDAFCEESYMREDDTECMELVKMVKSKEDSDIHVLLGSYLSICEDGDEVIESLYEFANNCKGFVEADEDTTKQVTKEEFEAVLSDCEGKCGIVSCIEKEHTLKMVEIPMLNKYRKFGMKFEGNEITLILPKIDINIDTKQYIAEELGTILYDVLKSKISPEILLHELNRYIPETRESKDTVKQLFREYFYSVVLYKERKPGIYPRFDAHMKQMLDMEYYKRIIVRYLKE